MSARWAIQQDDLLQDVASGETVTVVRGTYTHRYMDAQDHEMAAHGMGHMAGSYGSACDVVSMASGRRMRLKIDSRFRARWKNVTAAMEGVA
jgi:hypothetical protein